MEKQYKAWLTELDYTQKGGSQGFQVRIDCSEGYYIMEINPSTKECKIIKDRLNGNK